MIDRPDPTFVDYGASVAGCHKIHLRPDIDIYLLVKQRREPSYVDNWKKTRRKRNKKLPAHGGIQTHDLWITKHLLYHHADNSCPALMILKSHKIQHHRKKYWTWFLFQSVIATKMKKIERVEIFCTQATFGCQHQHRHRRRRCCRRRRQPFLEFQGRNRFSFVVDVDDVDDVDDRQKQLFIWMIFCQKMKKNGFSRFAIKKLPDDNIYIISL